AWVQNKVREACAYATHCRATWSSTSVSPKQSRSRDAFFSTLVIARSDSDVAIQSSKKGWVASLTFAITKRSRASPLHRSHAKRLLGTVATDFARCSIPRHSRPMPVKAFASAALAMDDGKNERKRIGSRTPTDAMVVFCRALRPRPRLQIREAHIYRRSTAVLAKGTRSRPRLSLRPCFLGRGLSVEWALPTPACP